MIQITKIQIISVLSIFLDRIFTAIFFEFEANPVVIYLGIYRWYGISIMLIFGILIFYSIYNDDYPKLTNTLAIIIIGMHILVTGINFTVII